MLEEQIVDEPLSVVKTFLAFNAPEWPANIGGTQSWLAPRLIYEWKFRCKPVKVSVPNKVYPLSLLMVFRRTYWNTRLSFFLAKSRPGLKRT